MSPPDAAPHGAWLALWNGFDPAREAEYDEWHAREHVPERLTVPGMLRASRWHCPDDAVYPYFTLYEMASIDVLATPQYQALLTTPTDWSRRMRPSFGQVLRLACRVSVASACGQGAALLSAELRGGALPGAGDASWQALAGRLFELPGVVAVRIGCEDTDVAPLPWRSAAESPASVPSDTQGCLLMLIEAQSAGHLQAVRPLLLQALATSAPGVSPVLRLHTFSSRHDAMR